MIANEFKEFKKNKRRDNIENEEYVMSLCCQHSSILGEFNKILFSNLSTGHLLIEFIENDGITYVDELTRWIIETVDYFERTYPYKRIEFCKHIQLLWSHVIDFYYQFVEGQFLDQQFHHYAMAFKKNPTLLMS